MEIRIRLKRKMSGKAIRKLYRDQRLHPKETKTGIDELGNKFTYEIESKPNYENRNIYWKNKPIKRKKDNPTVYVGENHVYAPSLRSLRLPKKSRKTAWKRLEKLVNTATSNKYYRIVDKKLSFDLPREIKEEPKVIPKKLKNHGQRKKK